MAVNRKDIIQLDIRYGKAVLRTVLFACGEVGELPTVTHQVTKLADIWWRNKAAGHKVMLEDVSNPLGILLVGFLAANRFDVLWVSKHDFASGFKNVVDRNPVFACGFHANILAVVCGKPLSAQTQVAGEGRKTLAFIGGNTLMICGSDTGDKEILVDIHSTADGVNDFEHNTSPQNKYLRNARQ